MLGTQREKTSTVKARLTTLSHMVAIAPMAKRNDREGAVFSGPITSSSLERLRAQTWDQPLFNLPESFERLPLEGAAKT
eukprot:scaffold44759_cov27-Phaeocystis_antarctica.AAC.1